MFFPLFLELQKFNDHRNLTTFAYLSSVSLS